MKSRLLLVLASLAMSNAVLAHTGQGAHGLTAGLAHPFTGLDHLLAMFAVGLWAAQMQAPSRRHLIWWLPSGFVFALVLGAAWAVLGGTFAFIETGIAASVPALGLAIALALRPPLTLSVALILLFGVCHGHAHGAEMPSTVTPATYAAGFLFTTVLLHLSGITLGLGARRAIRLSGIGIAGMGLYWIM